MSAFSKIRRVAAASLIAVGALGAAAKAEETIKMGLSLPLSGSGANWGKGAEFMCKQAAQEIKAAGGIKVKGVAYNVECIAYDNKFTSSEGTKVAQTLLNRDGVKYIAVFGTAPVLATQSFTERQGVMLFNTSWGMSTKGPKFPLTFQINNSPFEIMPSMVKYITESFKQAKTMVLLNANDATGRENESISRPMWEKAGIKVLASDFFERGTTEFQPIAARLASLKPDIVNLSTTPPAEAGRIFKELDVIGWKGVKISDNGTSADALRATGGHSVNNVFLGAAMTFDGSSVTENQRKVNVEATAHLGESLSPPTIAFYDAVYMVKAGMEKADSIEPKAVAAAMPSARFKTFYGGETRLGGKETYGIDQATLIPVYITQIVDGKVVERSRIERR